MSSRAIVVGKCVELEVDYDDDWVRGSVYVPIGVLLGYVTLSRLLKNGQFTRLPSSPSAAGGFDRFLDGSRRVSPPPLGGFFRAL